VTARALGRAGMSAEVIACRIVASLMIQYSAYLAAAVIVCGPGLWAGVFGDGGSLAITPCAAVLAAVLAAAVLSLALMPDDIEQRLQRSAGRTRSFGGVLRRLAKAPEALGSRVRTARDLVRERRLGLLGAVAYWSFDTAVLSVCFDAFGRVVPVAVVAVLAYRAISFWLPTPPGIAGYLALRSTVRGWRAADAKSLDSLCGERGHRTQWGEQHRCDRGWRSPVGARSRTDGLRENLRSSR
jgi:hypothetical protein